MTTPIDMAESSALTHAEAEVFQILSLLLQYPEDILTELDLIRQATARCTDEAIRRHLTGFLSYLKKTPLHELNRTYVDTFDFSDTAALYLTYTKDQEDRERGNRLIRLKRMYTLAGYTPTETELPDYLPLFLEFVAIAPRPLAVELVTEYRPAMQRIARALTDMGSPYEDVMTACLRAVDLLTGCGGDSE